MGGQLWTWGWGRGWSLDWPTAALLVWNATGLALAAGLAGGGPDRLPALLCFLHAAAFTRSLLGFSFPSSSTLGPLSSNSSQGWRS